MITSKHRNWLTGTLFVQNLLQNTNAKDASGNIVFGDIGVYIQQEVCIYCLWSSK